MAAATLSPVTIAHDVPAMGSLLLLAAKTTGELIVRLNGRLVAVPALLWMTTSTRSRSLGLNWPVGARGREAGGQNVAARVTDADRRHALGDVLRESDDVRTRSRLPKRSPIRCY